MGTSASAADDRRILPRRPFKATVELALAEEADGYEADAVDLSVGGMALRTAFLPDVGSELECRFALEGGESVAARAEVVWARDSGAEAGAFGLRFTDLAGGHEHAIRKSFPVDGDVLAPDANAPAEAEGAPRARLFLPGMEAPLRTRVRTSMDDALVLGSELSFLKLGEPVEVERDGQRVAAAIEDVSVEVDPRTSIACLVLTLALTKKAVAHAPRIAIAPARGAVDDAMPAIPKAPAPPSLPSLAARRPAQATEVLSSSDDLAPRADAVGPHPVMEMATADVLASDPGAARRAPPAWLVAMLASVRAGLRWLASHAGPGVRRVVGAVFALIARGVTTARSRLGRSTEATPAHEASRRAGGVVLRKQHLTPDEPPSASASSEPRVAWFARGRYGLYGLAAVGTVAIVAALATGRREPHARTPHPTVAVAPAPSAEPAEANPTPSAAPSALDAPSNEAPEPVAAAAPLSGDPRRMPSDLVAASRSRSANVDDAPSLRFARGATSASPRAVATHAAAVAPSHAPPAVVASAAPVGPTSRVVGNPSVRTGTTLRLRMDGPVTALAGGATGNAITLHLTGRRSLDLAAPLVHQDARLINAGVYNHGGSVDLTLRFRGAVPAFAARGRNDTLEIVLASAPPVAATAMHHAVRPVIASLRRHGR